MLDRAQNPCIIKFEVNTFACCTECSDTSEVSDVKLLVILLHSTRDSLFCKLDEFL